MAFDSPKAAHFSVTPAGVLNRETELSLRWRAARAVEDAGVTDMIWMTPEKRRLIEETLARLAGDLPPTFKVEFDYA